MIKSILSGRSEAMNCDQDCIHAFSLDETPRDVDVVLDASFTLVLSVPFRNREHRAVRGLGRPPRDWSRPSAIL